MRTHILLILACTLASATLPAQRGPDLYRGEYTFGHEVNVFCPDINAQCYWLSGETPGDIREGLRSVSELETTEPYTPICLVVEGIIDRDSPREGFAADYDGSITIIRVLGRCEETSLVLPSDLQHHRWVLEHLDGEPFQAPHSGSPVPELDFGDQMHVSGNTGCNEFTGRAVLADDRLHIEALSSTRRPCTPAQGKLERMLQELLTQPSAIAVDAEHDLILETDSMGLRFRLRDWVQ